MSVYALPKNSVTATLAIEIKHLSIIPACPRASPRELLPGMQPDILAYRSRAGEPQPGCTGANAGQMCAKRRPFFELRRRRQPRGGS